MSLIKLKTQNLKLKTNRTLGAGFTLIEMVISISILGVVAVIAAGFLLTSLSSSGKAEVNKEVRQNGNFALSVMEGLIVSAKSVACPTPPAPTANKEIDVTDINGNIAKFICEDSTVCDNPSKCKIASSSASGSVDLTATNVAVSGCTFTCTTAAGSPTNVAISFTVSQKTTGSLTPRPNEKSSVSFQTQVNTRNY